MIENAVVSSQQRGWKPGELELGAEIMLPSREMSLEELQYGMAQS